MAAVIGVCVMIGAATAVSERGRSHAGKEARGEVSMAGPVAWPVGTSASGGRARSHTTSPRSETRRCPDHHRGLRYYRQRHAHWNSRRGIRVLAGYRKPRSCPDARYLASVWRQRAARARKLTLQHLERRRAYRFRLLYEKWRCIHEHEGAWNANTGNGYYGGLQMDSSFYWTYGREFALRWGTPDRWPVWAQLTAAERAYQTRGFGPWPNTARMCGLL